MSSFDIPNFDSGENKYEESYISEDSYEVVNLKLWEQSYHESFELFNLIEERSDESLESEVEVIVNGSGSSNLHPANAPWLVIEFKSEKQLPHFGREP